MTCSKNIKQCTLNTVICTVTGTRRGRVHCRYNEKEEYMRKSTYSRWKNSMNVDIRDFE